jgi:hypothetical protein
MLEFLIDNIFLMSGIHMGTNCAPLLVDFMQGSLNKRYGDFVDRIYHIELEIKDTTDTARSASYLGLMLDINSEKEKDFNFPIVNFPFICSNTPTVRAYGVYISQLIRYLRTSFQNVLDRGMLLTRKQFQLAKLKSSLRNFHSRHLESINSCGIPSIGKFWCRLILAFFLQKRVVLFWCVTFWPFSFLVCLILATFGSHVLNIFVSSFRS